jgi:putative iron-regulated protein
MFMTRFHASRWMSVCFAWAITGCGENGSDVESDSEGPENPQTDVAPNTALPSNAADAVATYAQIASASYSDSLSMARALDAALGQLVQAPSEDSLAAARTAWLDSREPYLQTEVYRFYGGPIDDEQTGPEGMINAWPLDESHIDYVEGEPEAGIVNDRSVAIDTESLTDANLNPGETDVATGYHALEFLLWGQDFNDDGPGQRPYTDFVANGPDGRANADRRGEYLTATSALLVEHLEQLDNEWSSAPGNYRDDFEALPPAEALGRILSGMIILSGFELANERLSAALDAQDQEEEHSCFSDNTHRDMVQDVQGIQNVWLGVYASDGGTDVEGVGVRDVIAAGNAGLAMSLTEQISESVRLAQALQSPFDREIAPDNPDGNARVEALIDSLLDQSELLEGAFQQFGLSRIPDPI